MYGMTTAPGDESSFGAFDKGDFKYYDTDVVIPGRSGLNIVVGRSYHSALTNAGVINNVFHASDIRFGDDVLGSWLTFKDGRGIGSGWESTIMGYLIRSLGSKAEAYTYGWSSDPFTALSYKDYADNIQVIIGTESFRFQKDQNSSSWVNSVVSGRETLTESGNAYILTKADGT
ncbi:hypothetical protein EB093_09580, partial [bacterium]|nr:hypothetical protein [bacterium]